jgi:hypothetical protein
MAPTKSKIRTDAPMQNVLGIENRTAPSISGSAKASRIQAGRPVAANSAADRRENVRAAAGIKSRAASSTDMVFKAAEKNRREVGPLAFILSLL